MIKVDIEFSIYEKYNVPDGVKTDRSVNLVTRNYVEEHVEIGIASLRMIIDEKKTVKHLKFDW